MEALLNLAGLGFAIQLHSFRALVTLRVIQKNDLEANHAGTSYDLKLLMEAFCNTCLRQNNNRAVAGKGPLVYKEAIDMYSAFNQANESDITLEAAQETNRYLLPGWQSSSRSWKSQEPGNRWKTTIEEG